MSKDFPHLPDRPLIWPEWISGLQDFLGDAPEEVYIVGGAVRDALLHYPLHDLDLATSGDAIRLTRRIAKYFDGDFFALDAERDVGRALVNLPDGRVTIDVAHLRGAALLDDLNDRDFTINAMAVDLKGDLNLLIDPLDGEGDIAAKMVRRCAPHSLAHDPIRALRAVRQSIQFGMHIESETLRDMRAIVLDLGQSSPERLRDELFKLLAVSRPAAALRIADQVGLLQVIFPEVIALNGFQLPAPHVFDGWRHTLAVMENLAGILATIGYTRTDNTAAAFSFGMMAIQLDRYRKQLQEHIESLWPNERRHRLLLMLAAVLHEAGKSTGGEAGEIAASRGKALRLSNVEQQRLVKIAQNLEHPILSSEADLLSIHRFWRMLDEAGIDVCLLALADYLGTYGRELEQDKWLAMVERVRVLLEAYYEKYDAIVSPPVLVDGNQLAQEFGLKPGPIIGQLLDSIREAQVEGRIETAEDAFVLSRDVLSKQRF